MLLMSMYIYDLNAYLGKSRLGLTIANYPAHAPHNGPDQRPDPKPARYRIADRDDPDGDPDGAHVRVREPGNVGAGRRPQPRDGGAGPRVRGVRTGARPVGDDVVDPAGVHQRRCGSP